MTRKNGNGDGGGIRAGVRRKVIAFACDDGSIRGSLAIVMAAK